MPSSKIKVRIAEILKTNGYISDFELTRVEGQVGDVLKVTLKYGESRERSIVGLRRISKPGLRGLGIAIISTSQGLLTDRDAKAKSVGGEVLAYVW